MDVFNNSISERGNKTINQIQESHKILKSNLMMNNQALDVQKDIIIKLEENLNNLTNNFNMEFSKLQTTNEKVIEQLEFLKYYVKDFEAKKRNVESYLENCIIDIKEKVKNIEKHLGTIRI